MANPIIAIAGGLLLIGFIYFAFRQGMKVAPDDRQDRSGSSLRTQGPIATGLRFSEATRHDHLSPHNRHGVWVPAFAGTTMTE